MGNYIGRDELRLLIMKLSYCRDGRSRSAIVGQLLSPPRENLNEDVIQSRSNMERAPDL